MKQWSIFLLAFIILQSCIQDDIIDDRQDEVLSFNNSVSELTIKDTHQYETKFTNNVGKLTVPDIDWSTSDETVISVGSQGLLTAKSIGTATITAKVVTKEEKIIINKETIEVKPAKESLEITNVIQEIIINNTHQYTTRFINKLRETVSVTVNWSSSDNTIISVSNSGLITALSLGNGVTIKASATGSDGQEVFFEDEVMVTPVQEKLNINNPIEEIYVNTMHQYTITYTDNTGRIQTPEVRWSSSNADTVTIDSNGKITAVSSGEATIMASVTSSSGTVLTAEDAITIKNNESIQKSGTIKTTSSYALEGTFTLKEVPNTNNLELSVNDDYKASTSLPGLYLYLTNNTSTINNAQEVGAVQVFSGSHTYVIENTGINDFTHLLYWCKPFSVKVGEGEIK